MIANGIVESCFHDDKTCAFRTLRGPLAALLGSAMCLIHS